MNRISMPTGKPKAAPSDPVQVPKDIDGITFFGKSIPESVIRSVPLLHLMKADDVSILVLLAVDIFNANNISASVRKPNSCKHIPDDDFAVVLSALYITLKLIIRSKIHAKAMQIDLLKLHFPEATVDVMLPLIQSQRVLLETVALSHRCRFPTIDKFRWRVDVTISSGLLSKIMRPNLLFQTILTNGSIKTFEVSIEQFNQLRYGVAKLLHDMQTLERHPIVKVVNELERRDCEERIKPLDE